MFIGKALTMVMVATVIGLVGLLLGLSFVTAQEGPTASRVFSTGSVDPGGPVVVTITATGYGAAGGVVETLPDGFSYVADSVSSSDVRVVVDDQTVRFIFQGATDPFTYTVTASSTPGTYSFSGKLRDEDRMDYDVDGPTNIMVNAPMQQGPTASRAFSTGSVDPGGQVVVTITATGYGAAGGVVETLPDGFSYVADSVSSSDVRVVVDDQTVRFIFQGATDPFTYTVTASSTPGTYSFSGKLRDEDRMDYDVDGPSRITVGTAPPRPRPRPPANNPPVFPLDTVVYNVPENLPPGANVGEPVTATDPDGDTLTYALSGAEAAAFRIDSASGQITVGPDTSLDYETQRFYALAVRASDGNNGSDTTDVIVNVTEVEEPPPTGDPCRETLSGDGAVPGQWAAGCESAVGARGYARYYTFTLAESSEVTITLESSLDPYLYLREGEAKSGDFLHENDDIVPANTNSRIQETLAAGTYTIEATTFNPGAMGSFTLTVSGLGSTTTPPTPTDPCVGELSGDGAVTGQWAAGCESAVGARGYARYYTFTLAESSEVTITLESNLDPYLYLREGEAKSGDFLHENDDIVPANTNSRIQETLAAGTYTIEATTFNPGAMGSFTLTVSGLGSTTTPPTPTDPCVGELSGDGAVTGQWAAGCESAVGARGYARYYTFTLAESSEVTITLESNLDPYLYLREGEAKSGDFLHENDDIVPANTNSRIQETLAAGTYTIEATTFNPGAMGSFTLTVSGLGSTTTPPTPTDPCVGELSGDGAVTGQWAAGCESAVGARGYARYYTFTLAESSEVTITLESNLDPYLYLREGEAKSGDFLHENDDIVPANTNSRIQETLAAGTYTIEATTFNPGAMGSFTLTVSGW